MIVRKIASQVFQKSKRKGLLGKGINVELGNREKGFEQYLLEAFQGEIVKKKDQFSQKLSPLTRKNLTYLHRR